MLGLRTQEPQKFENFFQIVQEEARKKNSVFFCFCEEGNDYETETLEGTDLSGWLIPKEKVDEFEKLYHQKADLDDWADYFLFAEWSGDKNDPKIEFKEY